MGIKASIWGLYRGSAANPYFTNKKTNKMKELSKQEKISLLQRIKQIIKEGHACFICIALGIAASEYEGREYESFAGAIEKYVPELLKYRPKHAVLDSDGWFDPTESETGIGIINKTIKDIEASIASTLESD